MKKLIVLLTSWVLAITVEATTITTRISGASPSPRPLQAGALVPMLAVDITATEKTFPPDVYLVVNHGGGYFDEQSPFEGVYVGSPEKFYSWGPFTVSNHGLTVVGPIFLQEGVTRTVVLSAELKDDLSQFVGKSYSLNVNGISVLSSETEIGDQVTYTGTFPIRGEWFPVENTSPAESLIIRNVTEAGSVSAGTADVKLAKFKVVAQNGDVEIPEISFSIVLGQGDITQLKDARVSNSHDEIVADVSSLFFFETKGAVSVMFRTNIVVPEGTNYWTLEGTLPVIEGVGTTTLQVKVDNIGEVIGLETDNWFLPSIENDSNVIEVQNLVFVPFNGTFTRYLTIGSIGDDVRALQCFLNSLTDIQIATSGPGSPGNETFFFDENTKRAVMKYQTTQGIPATGFVGPITQATLNGSSGFTTMTPRITEVSKVDFASADKIGIALHGTIKPNTAYIVEVSTDLVNWIPFGLVNKTDSVVLKEYVGAIDKVTYTDKAFFRLVEKP